MSALRLVNRNTTNAGILLALAMTAVGSTAHQSFAQTRHPSAEASRLSTAVFRAGLKKRGLTELLAQHVKDFPPAGATEASIMMREIKLAESVDPSRSKQERRTAVAEANAILGELISNRANDPRRFEWRFALAHSLLHDEAEPYLTRLLYRSARPDRETPLTALTSRAVAVLTRLMEELTEEYNRIDQLSVGQFERLEGDGYMERLDALAPRAEYLLLWALLYDALPRDDADPARADRLHDLLKRLKDNPALVTTPHQTSHVQVQALLLTGMTHRLLNKHRTARQHLDRALAVAEEIGDAPERKRIDWAVTLAWLEHVRNDTEDARFGDAVKRVEAFRRTINGQDADTFGRRLMAALSEREVYRVRADGAAHDGRLAQEREYRRAAWQAVARLARLHPERRDQLYAALYDLTGPDAVPSQLDPLEQCAMIAGLLSEARTSTAEAEAQWDRAVRIGEEFLEKHTGDGGSLVPEVLYNMGVAEYRRGRLAAATKRFLEVVREYPQFSDALPAATFAVQLATEVVSDPALNTHPEARGLYREALESLLARFPTSDAGEYWRFYYAQLLDENGEFTPAAAQYALVTAAHEHHLDSLFYRARCLGLALQDQSSNGGLDRLKDHDRISEFSAARREFEAAAGESAESSTPQRKAKLRSWMAETMVLAAEVQILPRSPNARAALNGLADFEQHFLDTKTLTARVWRVRLLAYQQLGLLEDATRAVPEYIAADPEGSRATLQALYDDLTADADGSTQVQATEAGRNRAAMALVVAREIRTRATSPGAETSPPERRALTLQLARANLANGHPRRARELFESLVEDRSEDWKGPAPAEDAQVTIGLAHALFQMGDYARALPKFNRLATGLSPEDPRRWQALLGDLQCRSALQHPPAGIIRVIEQQKQLYPELGGPSMAPQLERLLRASRRRRDQRSDH